MLLTEDSCYMTNLDNILRNRDITLPPKVCIIRGMVFPVVTFKSEMLTKKKAERQIINAFKSWC